VDLTYTEGGEYIETGVFTLFQNQPNPFREVTQIGFVLPEAMEATMTIYDVTGRVIMTIEGDYLAGYNEVTLREGDLPASGLYYYQLDAEGYSASKSLIFTGK